MESSVGIATRYGMDGPGIEYRWGRDFLHLSRPTTGPHPAFYTISTGSCPEVKRPGRGVDHPPPYSAEIKERMKLYISSPTALSAVFQGEVYPYLLVRVLTLHPVPSDQDRFLMFPPKSLCEKLRLENKSGPWTKVTILKQSLMHFCKKEGEREERKKERKKERKTEKKKKL